ncbi:hypothetical protein VCUG_02251 [Vavraia culicis subsp. floridensis]|uniref:PSP1 C-terminal domain-containing protein n=1 Tax=Vavraia culicis (isolate floridensis) TaxID=948595 RepID=L2GS88_VAVCU|nr:uncharacterized protein VCUG_02251 [Vavraia culicis subsp. floridensis]ELA46242.1 hypothetical protein VCUG_02251 [Vavraia culicis subsp. floridensis]
MKSSFFFIHVNNPWQFTSASWLEKEYRIVGTAPFSPKKEPSTTAELIESLNEVIYLVEFNSGRMNIGYADDSYLLGESVILEADRGMDCGMVVAKIKKKKYVSLIYKIDKNLSNKELHPKKIFRRAGENDLKIIELKARKEKIALADCRARVKSEMLNMVIDKCEYQWDMNKLTFFFSSEYKIDFRELVKNLYKEYKIRIWMCAIGKSRNHHLRELLE